MCFILDILSLEYKRGREEYELYGSNIVAGGIDRFECDFYVFNLIKSGKSFVRENVITVDGKVLEIPMGKYISLGLTMLFYIMVMAICCLPSMLF